MSDILTSVSDGVLTITFNRMVKRNSFTSAMYAHLSKTLLDAVDDTDIRVVLVTGGERVFSADNDLGDFIDNPPMSPDSPAWQFVRCLAAFPKPLVVAVCGTAIGIGVSMLFHCDLIFASEGTRFSLPFVSLGVCPEAASSLILPQMMGHQRASWLLLAAESFNSDTALEIGLVNGVLPTDQVISFALKQAERLAAKPAEALIETKRLMKAHSIKPVTQRIGGEAALFARLVTSPAAVAAISAVKDRPLKS
jgi:enoyl-CoA hydratase/carnithine racemase